MTSSPTVTVVISSPLEPEHVATIRAVDERLEVLYEPSFLPRPGTWPTTAARCRN